MSQLLGRNVRPAQLEELMRDGRGEHGADGDAAAAARVEEEEELAHRRDLVKREELLAQLRERGKSGDERAQPHLQFALVEVAVAGLVEHGDLGARLHERDLAPHPLEVVQHADARVRVEPELEKVRRAKEGLPAVRRHLLGDLAKVVVVDLLVDITVNLLVEVDLVVLYTVLVV